MMKVFKIHNFSHIAEGGHVFPLSSEYGARCIIRSHFELRLHGGASRETKLGDTTVEVSASNER